MHRIRSRLAIGLGAMLALSAISSHAADCDVVSKTLKFRSKTGTVVSALSDGSVAKYGRLSIDLDGYPRAYHPDNYAGGAIESLCNAGNVYLPGQPSFSGASDCPRFMTEYANIRNGGWKSPTIGAIYWYGIVASDSVMIDSRTVRNVVPALQANGSGFFVSATALVDKSVTNRSDQMRYVDPSKVAYAAAPVHLTRNGYPLGTFGVALNTRTGVSVPFVVADVGPRIGEGSVALARRAANLPLDSTLTRSNRYQGDVSDPSVLWVFFGGTPVEYLSSALSDLAAKARAAFTAWGGDERLSKCVLSVPKP